MDERSRIVAILEEKEPLERWNKALARLHNFFDDFYIRKNGLIHFLNTGRAYALVVFLMLVQRSDRI